MENAQFKEIQRFLVLYIASIIFAIFFGIIIILQIIWNISLFTPSEPIWLLVVFFVGSVLGILFSTYQKLVIIITPESICINFGLSGETIFQMTDIKTFSIRQYDALKEFGGWGVRYNSKESCFTVTGNNALEIELNSNEKILIGTQKPELIKIILNQYISLKN